VLYADNKFSKVPIETQILAKIIPIATELGSALYKAKRFELERSKAEIDPLTGLSNKRMINDFLEKSFSDQRKEPEKMAATRSSLYIRLECKFNLIFRMYYPVSTSKKILSRFNCSCR